MKKIITLLFLLPLLRCGQGGEVQHVQKSELHSPSQGDATQSQPCSQHLVQDVDDEFALHDDHTPTPAPTSAPTSGPEPSSAPGTSPVTPSQPQTSSNPDCNPTTPKAPTNPASPQPSATPNNGPLTGPVNYPALYVVNGGDSSISVINTDTGVLAGVIALPGFTFPHHIYLSPDGNTIAVAFPGMDLSQGHDHAMPGMSGAVAIIDAKTGQMKKSRKLSSMNHNAVYSPDGSEIWTSQMEMPGSVLVFDSSTLATKQTIIVGDMPAEVTFSKDGKSVFVANGQSNTVSIINPSTKKVVKTVSVGEEPVGAWQGSNNVMYVDNEKGKTVTAIDASTYKVVLTYTLMFTPGMVATTPGAGGLWITDADNGKVTFNMISKDMGMGGIKTGAGAHAIAFTSDGTKGFISNQGEGTVTIIDPAQSTVLSTVKVGNKPNGMLFRSNAPSPAPTVTYSQIQPIISQNCAGGGCHSSGASQTQYVGSQSKVDANKKGIYSAINIGIMPQNRTLSESDKQLILRYCQQ